VRRAGPIQRDSGNVLQMCDFVPLEKISEKSELFFKNPLTKSDLSDIIMTSTKNSAHPSSYQLSGTRTTSQADRIKCNPQSTLYHGSRRLSSP
jgi:hypothetical protein